MMRIYAIMLIALITGLTSGSSALKTHAASKPVHTTHTKGTSKDAHRPEYAPVETPEENEEEEIEDIGPEPQRLYCAEQWTKLYEGQKANIKVTARGHYNQIAEFHCPDCSLDEHFVKPFLETEYRGKTGLMRLHECGFTKAVFKGMRGTEAIVVDVPKVFPDPNRLVCINDWSMDYQKNYPTVHISSRGDLNESIVFTCLNCPFQESFIAPFLLTVTDGKTAMERMKECGFTEVVFTNPMGTREVIRKVQ